MDEQLSFIKRNRIIELPTPFCVLKIEVGDKDLWAKADIEDWIFRKCGIPTQIQTAEALHKFEVKIAEVKSNSR